MINKLNANFKIFLPVIHVANEDQGIKQTSLSLLNGADGVFLINHSIPYFELFWIYRKIRNLFPKSWIGINCLDLDPIQVIKRMPKDIDGLWVDNSYINEELGYNQGYAKDILDTIHDTGWDGLYFGGVAFKYQKKVKDLIKTTEIACKYMDIITTSGTGTGVPPTIKKIEIMSEIIHKNNKKLAIASGITPKNIKQYKSADIFMVATGISTNFTHFNPKLVKKLQQQIHFYI